MKETSPIRFPATGDVLVASPTLLDPNFAGSLVYLHDVDAEGSLGLILNRPLGKTLGDLLSHTELPDFLRPLPLFFGGPVHMDQFLLALFIRDPETHRLVCDVQPDAYEIQEHLAKNTGWLRAFIGYAGWSVGQLEEECRRADWITTPSDEEMVLNSLSAGLWRLYVSGDERWKLLRDRFPKQWGLN